MRVLLWILGIPVLLIVVALLLVPLFLDEQKIVALASEQIEAQTGGTLAVNGDASLSLFPSAALATTDVTLTLPESQTRIEAGSFEAGVALLPLLGLSVEIDSIRLEALTVTTVAANEEAARAAELDTSTLSNSELDVFYAVRDQARKTSAAEAAGGAIVVGMNLEVGELSLRDIRVVTVDDGGETISELELKYFTASDLNIAGRPVAFSAELVLPDDEAPLQVVAGGEFTTDLDAEALSLDGVKITVTGATPDPVDIAASGEFALLDQVADLLVNLEIGDLQGNGKVRYAAFESPQIDATLALTELNPALLVLAGPDAVEAAEETPEAAGDSALPLHALRMIDTQAKLTIEKVIVEGHVLSDVDANLRVVDGVATLNPVTARVHNGDIEFQSELNGRYNVATVSARGAVSSLDVGSAMAVVDAGIGASGTADLTWDLRGEGATTDDLVNNLNGPISFTTERITLEGIAAEQMLCKGVALVNQEPLSAEFPADTAFDALSAQIQLADGIATLDPLTAQLAGVSLSGNGNLAISAGDLRASFRAQLAPELGELDPACRINERYTDLRWPVECKGNLADDPAGWCGVQTAEIIKDLAEGEVKRKVTKEAGKLLNKLFE